jgi:ElaA protein
MQIHWQCKHFDELSSHELYAIIKLRNEVFVVEQNCVFQDADGKDQYCYHLSGMVDDEIAAYARLVPSGISYPNIAIGRVITSPNYRRVGFGKALMAQAIDECYRLFGKQPIKIGAQLYLKDFYQSFGFEQTSEMYLEDDIPHIEMLLEPGLKDFID